MSSQENKLESNNSENLAELPSINAPTNNPEKIVEISQTSQDDHNESQTDKNKQSEENLKTQEENKEEENKNEEEEENMEEEEEKPVEIELGSFNQPLCPIHKIDAQNFCLEDNCQFALNCVLCVNDHAAQHHMPEKNNHLALTFNKNLADQLFNIENFDKEIYKKQIIQMILPIRFEFNKKCAEFENMLFNRLEESSHEFMILKVREFLDKSRAKYEQNKSDFESLKDLCSTFNDFLTLKKSDDIPKADEEIETYKSYIKQFERTQDLNFKYFEKKIKNIEDQPSYNYTNPSRVENETLSSFKPQNVNVEAPRHLPNVSNKLYKKTKNNNSRGQRFNDTVEVTGGVAKGPREIKKRRISIHDMDRNGIQRSKSNNIQRFDINNNSSSNFTSIVPSKPSILLDQSDTTFLLNQVLGQKAKLLLLYKGSRDGFSTESFHRLCDEKGPTINIIRSKKNGEKFGGYSEFPWSNELNNPNSNLYPKNSCLFSLTNKKVYKLNNKNNENALKYHKLKGPLFGLIKLKENDKVIYKFDLNIILNNEHSKSNFSSSYIGYTFGTQSDLKSNDLCSLNHFEIDEIEVYLVKF